MTYKACNSGQEAITGCTCDSKLMFHTEWMPHNESDKASSYTDDPSVTVLSISLSSVHLYMLAVSKATSKIFIQDEQ